MATTWRYQEAPEGKMELRCPTCGCRTAVLLDALKDGQTEQRLPGLKKTETVVGNSLSNLTMLQWMLALGTYFLVHRAMWDPGTALLEGAFVPVLVAVAVFTMTPPLLGEVLRAFPGNRLPVYFFPCPDCGRNVLFASNGKRVASPVLRPYSCSTCKKSFASDETLAQHRREGRCT